MICSIFQRTGFIASVKRYFTCCSDFISPRIRQRHCPNLAAPCRIALCISGTNLVTVFGMIIQIIVQIRICVSHRIKLSVYQHFVTGSTICLCPAEPHGGGCFLLFCNRKLRYGKRWIFLLFSYFHLTDKSLDFHGLFYCCHIHFRKPDVKLRCRPNFICHLCKLFLICGCKSTKFWSFFIVIKCLARIRHLVFQCL